MNCNSDEKGEKYFLTINQKSKRKYPDIEEFHYAKATIIIGKKLQELMMTMVVIINIQKEILVLIKKLGLNQN